MLSHLILSYSLVIRFWIYGAYAFLTRHLASHAHVRCAYHRRLRNGELPCFWLCWLIAAGEP